MLIAGLIYKVRKYNATNYVTNDSEIICLIIKFDLISYRIFRFIYIRSYLIKEIEVQKPSKNYFHNEKEYSYHINYVHQQKYLVSLPKVMLSTYE